MNTTATSAAAPSASNSDQSSSTSQKACLKIVNKKGLHARASARFVKCAESFDAKVQVSRDGQTVGGSSIMGLMMLGASHGCEIEVSCSGPEANAALESLTQLVADRFGEAD